jgi:sigma-B regulation protein RsbU (phosphoserine phosphatase)
MNAHVAVFAKDPKIFENLKAVAEASNFIMHDSPAIADYQQNAFVICDVESFLKYKKDLSELNKYFLYVISAGTDEENMKLVETHELHHLVGLNEGIYANEIMNHLRKAFDQKIWGLKTYLDSEAEIKTLSLSDSKFTNEMIKEALGHFDFQDYFSSPIEYIQVMANELISNSLYKGPNRKRQEQGLESVDRKSPVFLKGSELVQVTLSMDSKGVALSVQDSFGGLSYELLIASLKRSFEEKTAMEKKDGAGLGLYLTFLHSNQFIINYRKDFRTEVICIIEKNKRYKNYKQRIRSFHFFQEVPSEKIINK